MQPYFFPYIGYFQTIKNCDIYVNLDHVNFKKSGFMTRNVLKNGIPINVKVHKASVNKTCIETYVNLERNYFRKLKNKLHHLYSKTNNYEIILEKIIEPTLKPQEISISNFNLNIIKKICNYLEIKTKIIDTSYGITDKKKDDCVIEIIKSLKGTEYINSIGGKKLYSFDKFKNNNIQLCFIKSKNLTILDPYNSILDTLFLYDKKTIITCLSQFELEYE